MSYDLAVWRGPAPADDEAAGEEFERRADASEEDVEPASPEIVAFVDELLRRYPDLGESGDEDSPWVAGPLLGDASGGFIYLAMTYPGAGQALEFIVEVAHRHGLVCFDPQAEALLVPERLGRDDAGELVPPSEEALRGLTKICSAVGREQGYQRVRRYRDWRRYSSVHTGFEYELMPTDGAVVIGGYAMVPAVLDYHGLLEDERSYQNLTAWHGETHELGLPIAGPLQAEREADVRHLLEVHLLPELDIAGDENWLYQHLVRVNEAPAVEPYDCEQLLIWAASTNRSAQAEFSAARWLERWEPWMEGSDDNMWTAIRDVHNRYGRFRLPEHP